VTGVRRTELGDVAEVRGRLARVVSINEQRCITFAFIDGEPCPTCGREDRVAINEGCPNWRSDVQAPQTVPTHNFRSQDTTTGEKDV
jgi:hypothetical protein